MSEVARLTNEERHWLQTVRSGPIVKPSVDGKVPAPVLESLLEKQLVRWKNGFADVSLLVVTELGATVSA